MIKSLAVAAVLSLGLAGYAVAQEAAPAPAAPMAAPMHHHHHHHHHHYHHHHHHMHHEMAPAPAVPRNELSRGASFSLRGYAKHSGSPDKLLFGELFCSPHGSRLPSSR